MRVLLVHAKPLTGTGGAEISFRYHVRNAPKDIAVDAVLPDSDIDLSPYDAVVLGNLRPAAPSSNGGVLSPLKTRVWNCIRRSPLRSAAFRWAYRPETEWADFWREKLAAFRGYIVKSERDVHACTYRDGRCVETGPVRRVECGCGRAVPEAFERLYNACDAVQFLSPMHRDAINQLVNIRVPRYVIAPPLDFSRFRSTVPLSRRKRAALITGDRIRVSPAAEELAVAHGFRPEQIDYLSVPHEEMPEQLNRYQAVVVDPVMLHAFGRLAAEALACGCRLIAGSRVGAMSWPDPLQACRESNTLFWKMVTGAQPARREFETMGAAPR